MPSPYQWIYEPAEDETVDAQWVLKTPTYAATNYAVQCCEDGEFAVNEYFYDSKGQINSCQFHGFFRSMKVAKAKAEALQIAKAAQS